MKIDPGKDLVKLIVDDQCNSVERYIYSNATRYIPDIIGKSTCGRISDPTIDYVFNAVLKS